MTQINKYIELMQIERYAPHHLDAVITSVR